MKKRKNVLPSGSYRVRVYAGTDVDGKKQYKSFTAPTKKEAQVLANEWKVNKVDKSHVMSVSEAVKAYIETKRYILSPYTLQGYFVAFNRIKTHIIGNVDINNLTIVDIQGFVNDLTRTLSPKTVTNTYGLLSSSIKLQRPDITLNITLPQRQKIKQYIPTDEDIQSLINACRTSELKIAILLASVCTLRRGEVCAVCFEDVNFKDKLIEINKAYVKNGNTFELSHTKTYDSTRTVPLPDSVEKLIKKLDRTTGEIIPYTPDQLYDRFLTAQNRANLPHFTFHSLRHAAAAKLHASGCPDRYLESIGGWKPNSSVLKRVYENVLEQERTQLMQNYINTRSFDV